MVLQKYWYPSTRLLSVKPRRLNYELIYCIFETVIHTKILGGRFREKYFIHV